MGRTLTFFYFFIFLFIFYFFISFFFFFLLFLFFFFLFLFFLLFFLWDELRLARCSIRLLYTQQNMSFPDWSMTNA